MTSFSWVFFLDSALCTSPLERGLGKSQESGGREMKKKCISIPPSSLSVSWRFSSTCYSLHVLVLICVDDSIVSLEVDIDSELVKRAGVSGAYTYTIRKPVRIMKVGSTGPNEVDTNRPQDGFHIPPVGDLIYFKLQIGVCIAVLEHKRRWPSSKYIFNIFG